MLYKLSEWESGVSGFHCGCLDDLGHNSNAWYLPARVLGISPAAFIKLLITEYKPDHVYYKFNDDGSCFFGYSWDMETNERKFKNMINRVAREKNFQI